MVDYKIGNSRQTKYCKALVESLTKMGHATNLELLQDLRQLYPNLSATTVHRATARLASRNQIGIAPANKRGSTRYDINSSQHDHFLCQACDRLVDIDIKDQLQPLLEQSLKGFSLSSRLTIAGRCHSCQLT